MFNPAKAAKNIKNEFIDYITTSYSFADSKLQEQLKKELIKSIDKGPIIEINDVFTTSLTIRQLIDKGIISPLFLDLEKNKLDSRLYKHKLPVDRPLYLHQEKAVKKISNGENIIISTGTGSGKTNCFLIPVINELLKEKENGTLGPGVRAIFIYPMNALSNDQMRNIREILMFYPDITFGSYNGATEYDEKNAIAVYRSMFANEKILSNEILSRDKMKETPPNILFTNYAMLEHMLLRPKDDVLFSNADFKFVVLDEAHVYNGATGIETSLLLRRLRARISASRETQFILTSATLGNNDDEILEFANNLCGVHFSNGNIIRASRENYVEPDTIIEYPIELYNQLADEKNIVKDVLSKYGYSVKGNDENEILYNLLINSTLYNTMRKNILGFCDIRDFSKKLNVHIDLVINFISLCTRAQKNKKSLVDAKYHYFIKSLEGCYITLNKNKKLFLNRQKTFVDNNNFEFKVFETAICDDCGRIALVGKIENRKLVQVNKLGESVNYYFITDDRIENFEDEDDKKEIFYLCIKCGGIVAEDEIHNLPCDCGIESYIKIVKAHNLKNGARCGNCGSGIYKRLYLGNEAATSVLATALYEELPELKYEEEEQNNIVSNIFAKAVLKNKKKVVRKGRQFLAFSDSRQQAAKFACYMEKSYKDFLRRRGIWRLIDEKREEIIANDHSISDFVTILTNYFTTTRSFIKNNIDESNSLIESRRNAWVGMLNELVRYNSNTSLTSLGRLQFEYIGNDAIIEMVSTRYNIPLKNAKALLNLLAFEIVKTGAVITDNESDIGESDREYIFYSNAQKYLVYYKNKETILATEKNWAPTAKTNKENEFYSNYKMYLICYTLNIDEKSANDFLKDYFDFLTKPEYGNNYCMRDLKRNGSYVMPVKYFRVKINGSKDAKWYICKKCGRITQFNINNKCCKYKCDGNLMEINPKFIEENNHYAKLYSSQRMSPLFIKEHTAQLSKKESAEYQQQFIKKEINALSCSTTFEMGVDVGDLETVFLRNMPPMPSNYAQRAGRAGRSINAAAFALTFAKLSSHDFAYFKNPESMIKGTILPPLFKLDNEKIVRRHIYAIALSMFFANNEEMYNHNDAEKFINQKGYLKFIEWLNMKPECLKSMLKLSIPNINDLHKRIGINNFEWIQKFSGEEGVFTQLRTEYENNLQDFEKQIKKMKKENLQKAAQFETKKYIYSKNQLIEFLARGNILPKYGFPVDTVELYQHNSANKLSKLRLCRDLQIAIAEYAPSSEIVADGKLYTSRYIKKATLGTDKKEWHTAYIAKCTNPECETINYSIVPIGNNIVKCSSCGQELNCLDFKESIEPRNGFVAEKICKEVPMTQQEKNYKSEDFYIGNKGAKCINKLKFIFNGIGILVESTTNDSLLVKSSTNFYVCDKCGYAIAEDEKIGEPKIEKQMHYASSIITEKKHESLFNEYKCTNRKLKRTSLHHVFNTDVAKISFECDTDDYNTMVSVMYAILNSFSMLLNIERKDIKACLSRKILSKGICEHSIIIYDAVPGGAGHSRRLVTNNGRQLYDIFMYAQKQMENCDCDPSCYKCLRSYNNQKIHDRLDRHLASAFLKKFKGDIEIINIE